MSYVTSYIRYSTYDIEYDIVRLTYDVVQGTYDIVRRRMMSYLARIQMGATAALRSLRVRRHGPGSFGPADRLPWTGGFSLAQRRCWAGEEALIGIDRGPGLRAGRPAGPTGSRAYASRRRRSAGVGGSARGLGSGPRPRVLLRARLRACVHGAARRSAGWARGLLGLRSERWHVTHERGASALQRGEERLGGGRPWSEGGRGREGESLRGRDMWVTRKCAHGMF
jgi:hypothetical protein